MERAFGASVARGATFFYTYFRLTRSVSPPDERGSNMCKRQAWLSRGRRPVMYGGGRAFPLFLAKCTSSFYGRLLRRERRSARLVLFEGPCSRCVARGGERRGRRRFPTRQSRAGAVPIARRRGSVRRLRRSPSRRGVCLIVRFYLPHHFPPPPLVDPARFTETNIACVYMWTMIALLGFEDE